MVVDTLSVETGEEFNLNIMLRDRVNIALLGASRIRTTLRFNRTAFVPLTQDPPVFDGDDRLLTVSVPLVTNPQDVALSIPCVATLGKVEYTDIVTENTEALNGELDITEVPGHLTLLGICREGGTRLIEATAPVQIQQNVPNPFNPVTEITFSVIEQAYTELLVFDRLGREVAVLHRGPLAPGTYRVQFDGSGLPSGVYVSVLRTPTYTASRKMLLVK
jgi:hypothetical protein